MAFTLGRYGAEVTAVGSGRAALVHLADASAARKPHVLVSDLGMPDMGGHEMLRQIRAMESERGESALPGLLVTAYARAEDRERALEAGFAEHLARPVQPERLAAVIARLRGGDR